jgi:hypothetical protein
VNQTFVKLIFLVTVCLAVSGRLYGQRVPSDSTGAWPVENVLSLGTVDSVEIPPRYEGYLNELNPYNRFNGYIKSALLRPVNLPVKASGDLVDHPGSIWSKGVSYIQNQSSLGGDVYVESYASNVRLPYQLGEQYYTRIYATPKLNLLGLPFKSDLYYTTETNTFYNSNSIGFTLDVEALKQQTVDRVTNDLDITKSQLKVNALYRIELQRYTEDLERIIANEQRELHNEQKVLQSKLHELKNDQREQIESRAYAYKDSVRQHGQNRLDSALDENKAQQHLNSSQTRARHTYDSLNRLYEQKKQKVETLKSYYMIGMKLYRLSQQKDSIYQSTFNTIKSKSDSIKSSEENALSSRVFKNKWIQKIQNFSIGSVYPYYSDMSINGIAIRGTDVAISRNKSVYRVSLGKTLSEYNTLPESGMANSFDRNSIAVQTGWKDTFGHFSFIGARFWDGKNSKIAIPLDNTVGGFEFSKSFFQSVFVYGEVLTSHTNYNSNQPVYRLNDSVYGFTGINSLDGLKLRSSSNLSVTGKIDNTSSLIVKLSQVHLGFRSLGSPFHRTDYREVDLTGRKSFIKNQVHSALTYKNWVNNLSNTLYTRNTMGGLGISVYSSFSKKPNIIFSHMPYEQGNNHTDSILRTNNRLATTMLGLNYGKTFKSYRFKWAVNYTRSMIEYFQLGNQLTKTHIFNATQFAESAHWNAQISYTRSSVFPGVDTLNFDALMLGLSHNHRGHQYRFNLNARTSGPAYNMLISTIGYKKNFHQKIAIDLSSGLRYLNGYWGFDRFWAFHGQLRLTYLINREPVIIKPN